MEHVPRDPFAEPPREDDPTRPAGAPIREDRTGLSAPSKQERSWAMAAHLSSLLAAWMGGLSLLGPLVVWLIKKDEMPFVDDQGKEALNFQILMTLILVGLGVGSIATCGVGLFVAIPGILVVAAIDLIFVIIAAIKANEGVAYRYPFNWRLIK